MSGIERLAGIMSVSSIGPLTACTIDNCQTSFSCNPPYDCSDFNCTATYRCESSMLADFRCEGSYFDCTKSFRCVKVLGEDNFDCNTPTGGFDCPGTYYC